MILILVNVQKGFVHESNPLIGRITSLLKSKIFDKVIATKFVNSDGGKDCELVEGVEQYADCVIEKSVYSCVSSALLQQLRDWNEGSLPEDVYLAGVDLDGCVLKTALDLFEQSVRPVVLTWYCGSSGGPSVEQAALLCLERSLGKNQIVGDSLVPEETSKSNPGFSEEMLFPMQFGLFLIKLSAVIVVVFCVLQLIGVIG